MPCLAMRATALAAYLLDTIARKSEGEVVEQTCTLYDDGRAQL